MGIINRVKESVYFIASVHIMLWLIFRVCSSCSFEAISCQCFSSRNQFTMSKINDPQYGNIGYEVIIIVIAFKFFIVKTRRFHKKIDYVRQVAPSLIGCCNSKPSPTRVWRRRRSIKKGKSLLRIHTCCSSSSLENYNLKIGHYYI
jgi:hypothetical protein